MKINEIHSMVISISNSRLLNFYNIFEKTLKIHPQLIEGVQDKKFSNLKNCTLSHLKCVKIAKELNLPMVLIFEDDAYPCTDVNIKFQEYTTNIPNDIKFMQIGWLRYPKNEPQSFDNIINHITTRFSGAQSYIMFQKGYDDFINYFEQINNDNYSNDNENFNSDLGMCKLFIDNGGYVTQKPLFIQYNSDRSMDGHCGYIFNNMGSQNPPFGFVKIEDIL